MCIICIKEKGVRFPSMETVRTMCENNSHGFSLVYNTPKDGTKVFRTLNQEAFLKEYKRIKKKCRADKTSLYIHARIKTHGTQKLENCHGWIDKECGLAFAHNGILSGVNNRGDMTDSETFFRDLFVPAFLVGGWQAGERAIKAIIGTSKFVFMDSRGNISHYGNYIEDDGLLYSNTSYIPYTRPTYTTRAWYPSNYDLDFDDWK